MPSLDRRSLLQRALLVTGAVLTPGFSLEALAAEAASAPVLDTGRFALLSAVADTIVPKTDTPGALDAGVPKLVDGLLQNWAAPDRRTKIVGALDAIDRRAQERHGKAFVALAPTQRHELLKAFDVEALKQVPRTEPIVGNPMMAGPSYANPGYGKLKELIVLLYYYSEPALTHELVYEHSPGEWQPSIPITSDSRQTGGLGLF